MRIVNIFLLLIALASGCIGEAPSGEQASGITKTETTVTLESKVSDLNSVTVEVTPKSFAPGQPIAFEIVLNTHVVELGYDLTKIATLVDGAGNEYQPLGWDGASPGGHHRSGVLTFPTLPTNSENIKLVLSNINGADRVFEWSLKG